MTKYRLTGRLETSELAELYAATRDDNEPVVIKLFHSRNSDVKYAQDLADTARQLSAVKARGIVRYLELGLVKDRLAVVRQSTEGLTLGQLLQRLVSKEFVLAPPLALWIVVQLLETVQLAHEAGAVHGALTPGNVILDPDGAPSICDFGALRALQAVPALRKSFGGRGRDAYRAPEVVKGDSPSVESDIFSVGAIAYELLTLREPIGDRTGTMSTRSGGLPPPSRLDRRLNARIDPIILRALELSENRRFRSAGEFASALRNFLANNGGIPPPEELRRFLEPLRLRESTQNVGPVPFSDPFALREVRGADLPPVTERTALLDLRPSFSGPRPIDLPDSTDPNAATVQAAPGFEEYRPEQWTSQSVTQVPRGMAEPRFDEGTDPGQAGPLERGWEAPAGAPPPRPRGQRAGHDFSVVTGRPRHPRVKFIEDFTQPPTDIPSGSDRPALEAPPPPSGLRARAAPQASGPKGVLPPPPRDLKGMEITGPLDYAALPPDTNQQVPRPMNTSERFLAHDLQRRKRMLLFALALAFVGAFSFALAIRRYGARRTATEIAPPPRGAPAAAETYDPAYQTVNGALKKYFRTDEEQPPVPAPEQSAPNLAQPPAVPNFQPPPPTGAPVRPPPAAADAFHKPPSKDRAAFLTISSDVPAIVYIDDLRVKKRTPLVRYPVQPGQRRIVLEAVDSGERKNLQVSLEKGKLRKLEERFRSQNPRR